MLRLSSSLSLNPISSVQCLSHVQTFVTPWTAAGQASLSITNSQSLLRLMSIESGMPSNHVILCHPLLLLPSIFPSIRVFSHESILHIRWPKYWSFSFSICPSNEYSGLIYIQIVSSCLDCQSVMLYRHPLKRKMLLVLFITTNTICVKCRNLGNTEKNKHTQGEVQFSSVPQ